MYNIPVEHIYILDDVLADPRAERRARRLAGGLGAKADVISRAQVRELRARRPAVVPSPFPRRTGSFDYSRGWTIVLGTYVERGHCDDGICMTTFRDGGRQMEGEGVCRSALELHAAFGCFHRCAYCFVDPHFLIACDLESLAERIPEFAAQHPQQKLFKFDNLTDTIVLEPEYGASELLVPLFAGLDDRFLLLYTKSDNMDHLLPLHHGGHTIINWSLSTLSQSRTIEAGTPDLPARIRAMAACASAGYTVRARISPIVPLSGWRDEFTELADALFSAVKPDLVTIDVVGWCRPDALADAMDVSRLEPAFADAVRAMIDAKVDYTLKYLFSHELRLSVLRHAASELRHRSPATPIAICNETRRMWNDVADLLTMTPDDYACCCGPTSVPGHPMLGV